MDHSNIPDMRPSAPNVLPLENSELLRIAGRWSALCSTVSRLPDMLVKRNPDLTRAQLAHVLWSMREQHYLTNVTMIPSFAITSTGIVLFFFGLIPQLAAMMPMSLYGIGIMSVGIMAQKYGQRRQQQLESIYTGPTLPTYRVCTGHETLDAISNVDPFEAEHVLRAAGMSSADLASMTHLRNALGNDMVMPSPEGERLLARAAGHLAVSMSSERLFADAGQGLVSFMEAAGVRVFGSEDVHGVGAVCPVGIQSSCRTTFSPLTPTASTSPPMCEDV